MEIKILYEENIINGYPHYTIIKVPDGDYATLLDEDYQMRWEEAPEDKRDKVVRFHTLQELYDHFNRITLNGWRKHHRHTADTATPKRLDGKRGTVQTADIASGEEAKNRIEDYPDNSDAEKREKQENYEATYDTIRRCMKPDQAELIISVIIDKVPKKEYAAKLDISPSALSHRLETAKKNFKKIFPESSIFIATQG